MTPQEDFRSRSQTVRRSARLHLLAVRRARLAKRGLQDEQVAEITPLSAPEQPAITALHPDTRQPDRDAVDDDAEFLAEPDMTAPNPAPVTETPPLHAPPGDNSVSDQLTDDLAIQRAVFAELSDDPVVASITDAGNAALAQVTTAPTPPVAAFSTDDLALPTAEPSLTMPADLENPADDPINMPVDDTSDQPAESAVAAIEDLPPAALETHGRHPEPPVSPPDSSVATDLYNLPGAGPGLIWILSQCGINTMSDLANSDADTLTPKLGLVGQILDVTSWLTFAREQVVSR